MDNKHSPQELLNFWKKGKTFNEALSQFTDLQIRQEYGAIQLNSKQENIIASNAKISELVTDFLTIISESNEFSQKRENVLNKLKSNLLDKIKTEKLIGLGYEAPIKYSDDPKIIPLHIWPYKISEINWDESSISKDGITFLKIKLIKKLNSKNTIPEPIKELPDLEIQDKKTGRPSHVDKIIFIYGRLKDENKINYQKPLKWNITLIRQAILSSYPELKGKAKGLGDDAIANKISSLFNADKVTDKPT